MAAPCLCLQIDGPCQQTFEHDFGTPTNARPDAGPEPTRPVFIKASVGLNGFNRPDDVKNIQRALNHLLPEVGGAVPFLDDDGKVGPKTCAAIKRFQLVNFGWADSRVDTDQASIKRINFLLTMQPSNPYNGDPTQRVKYAVSRLRVASFTILTAENQISTVIANFNRPPTGLFGTLFAERLALLERHFKISKLGKNPLGELERLRDTYRNMRSVITKSVPTNPKDDDLFSEFMGESAFAFDPHEEQLKPTTMAYTSLGGWHRKGELFAKPPRPADRIYLRAVMDRSSDPVFVQNIVHELAHFVSDRNSRQILDYAYGWINDPRMSALPAQRRVENAQNFSTYAYEARFGQQNGRLPL